MTTFLPMTEVEGDHRIGVAAESFAPPDGVLVFVQRHGWDVVRAGVPQSTAREWPVHERLAGHGMVDV